MVGCGDVATRVMEDRRKQYPGLDCDAERYKLSQGGEMVTTAHSYSQ